MDNPGEILRLCRLCLVKDQVNIPIFEEQGDIRQIFLKISSCLPVKVSRDDKLPKKICDGCSNKLDLLYEFWNNSANAEKTLLSWLGQAGVKDADETISAVAQQIAKPAETQVKQETLEDGHATSQAQDSFTAESIEEEAKDESEAPPPKRARRTAAVKAQISITPESDDDDDMDSAEAMTKVEDESDESDGEDKDPSYGEVPGTSADDQAGPSGVGKDGVEAPENYSPITSSHNLKNIEKTTYKRNTAGGSNGQQLDPWQLNVTEDLEKIKTTLDQQSVFLSQIWQAVQVKNVQALQRPADLPEFPINGRSRFTELEDWLNKDDNFIYMRTRLVSIGGATVRACVMNMMKYIISNKLGMVFNWAGKAPKSGNQHKKYPFKETNAYKAINEAVKIAFQGKNQEGSLFGETTDKVITQACQDWLKQAKHRYQNSQKQ